jgi:hypothetical protein
MKKILIAALCLLSTPAMAEPLAYPGSAWGVLTTPSSGNKGTPEEGNWVYTGKITQGVDWDRFGKDDTWVLNTYASVGYSVDTKKLDYNNKVSPAVGVKVSKLLPNGVVDIGTQLVVDKYFLSNGIKRNEDVGVQAYVSYWFGWGR